MLAKIATSGLLKIKLFWNTGYDVTVSVPNVTNKILSRDSNYIVDVIMWSKFGNYSISMREVITVSIFIRIWEVVLVQFQQFETSTRYELEIWNKCGKRVKIKVRKFWGLIPTFAEVTGEKLVGGLFAILNRVNVRTLDPPTCMILILTVGRFNMWMSLKTTLQVIKCSSFHQLSDK